MKKNIVLMIASTGFQEHEYQATRNTLENAGYTVTVVSDKSGIAVGHAGAKVEVDCDIAHVYPSNYAAFYMIGGPGTMDCLDNEVTCKVLNEVFALQKPYGAICLAPRILARAKVLRYKKATGWNGDGFMEDIFKDNDVIVVQEPVVVDALIVTANGPAAADDFGIAIVKVLSQALQK